MSWRDDIPDAGIRSQADLRAFLAAMPGSRKAMLRPMAETLAMLDGNAFFGMDNGTGYEHWEQYLPSAHALFEANGGTAGWAGEASFAQAGETEWPRPEGARGEA